MASEGPSVFARLLLVLTGFAVLGVAFVWSQLPKPGEPRIEVTQGLVGVRAGGSYAWVLKTAHGAALVDTGSDSQGEALLAELRREGVTPEQVHTVLITHGHKDHWAGAHLFPQARVLVGAADIPVIQGAQKPRALMPRLAGRFMHAPVPEKMESLKAGETLDVDGESVRVIATPGHTPGSVMFLWKDVLFSGDSLMGEGGKVDASPSLFSESRDQNLESLKQLADVPFTRVADGHTGLVENAREKLRTLLR